MSVLRKVSVVDVSGAVEIFEAYVGVKGAVAVSVTTFLVRSKIARAVAYDFYLKKQGVSKKVRRELAVEVGNSAAEAAWSLCPCSRSLHESRVNPRTAAPTGAAASSFGVGAAGAGFRRHQMGVRA
jgi:hypothetical protein